MKYKVPKIITYAFYLQIVLFIVSVVVLGTTGEFDGLLAVYTLIPVVILGPIIACLGIFFPYREWKKYGSIFIGAALVINISVSLTIFIRFVILSFLLHVR